MATDDYSNFFKKCRKILGVGNNFRIAGVDPATYPSEPLIFLKVPTSMIQEGKPINIPEGYILNYEVELGVIIGEEGSNIPEDQALKHIGGYCVSLDMTAMDEIKKCREKGMPWLAGKCWDTFTPVSDFIHPEKIPNPHDVDLWLKLDGVEKQAGNTKDLVFDIPKLISYVSKMMTLEKGDLILSGTPAGAGPVKSGQVIECGIKGVKSMKFEVVSLASNL